MANKLGATLFPILPQQPTGIARLAAEAEHADDGHLIEFKMLKVRSILNKSVSKRQLSLAYSINPYRGCEFGCKYCYARYTHEFMAPKVPAETSAEVTNNAIDMRDPLAFERMIFLKQNAAWLLEQELKKIDPADEVALGTATDPYQPIERRARITRSLLEVFARKEGYRLGIVTKSRLIERDIDLLVQVARRNTLVVHVTITTPDAALARLLEPRAPRPDLRFQAVKRLREAGIVAGVFGSPLLPGITDNEEALDGMARRAAAVGASFFAAHPLFLKPCSRPTYLSFVREHFPALQADYAKRFATADFAGREYRERLARMVDSACRRYGLGKRSSDALLTRNEEGGGKRPTRSVATTARQQRLFA
ncbi:SPL family radical SAM protein [Tunturiibacter gelidoferens]|uniref:DNA repair photolyase n=1 Tax=Tunturiibacter lichenicola TaxID=2051959 RepID=A0A7Y9NPA0_9BACT|nr:radical SAM protein [Edaphobacter lichenicola]NYF53041.1 DNA repair photolyase [Edaphobacter lichenicola]